MTIRKRLERLESKRPDGLDLPTIMVHIVARAPDGEIISRPEIAKIPKPGNWLEVTRGEDEAEAAFLERVESARARVA